MPYKKGESGNLAGKPKGIKNRETLIKEERRAIFEAQISKKWLKIIDKLKPEYVADQFLGKAPDKVELEAKINTSIVPELLEIAEEELKRRKLE